MSTTVARVAQPWRGVGVALFVGGTVLTFLWGMGVFPFVIVAFATGASSGWTAVAWILPCVWLLASISVPFGLTVTGWTLRERGPRRAAQALACVGVAVVVLGLTLWLFVATMAPSASGGGGFPGAI